MKKFFKFIYVALAAEALIFMPSCSKEGDEPNNDKPKPTTPVKHIYFDEIGMTGSLIGGPTAYGANLYYGADNQITTGYLASLAYGKYAQFSINYGETYDQNFNSVWGYSYYNGGLALSNFHNMEEDSYLNQLSVYAEATPNWGNFVVANGSSYISDPKNAVYSDYSGCAKVYITDSKGFTVSDPGVPNSKVTGECKEAMFEEVYVNNTTYTFLTVRDGNAYTTPLKESKGWFKAQFIAFEDDDPNGKPLGYTEVYLANFDKSLADGYEGIIDEWTHVDLSVIPECSILVINFVGSDTGEYGLNTPAYCALTHFAIAIDED